MCVCLACGTYVLTFTVQYSDVLSVNHALNHCIKNKPKGTDGALMVEMGLRDGACVTAYLALNHARYTCQDAALYPRPVLTAFKLFWEKGGKIVQLLY